MNNQYLFLTICLISLCGLSSCKKKDFRIESKEKTSTSIALDDHKVVVEEETPSVTKF